MSAGRSWLKDFAALAEIIAAGGVLISLVYVGRELRANTAATEGATYQQMIQASDDYLLAVAMDSSLAAIVSRAQSSPEGLNNEEALRYIYLRRTFWRNMENAFVQHQRGVLADTEWATYHRLLCTQTGDFTWRYHQSSLSPVFAALVERCEGG